jgi:DnaK suppressor protein
LSEIETAIAKIDNGEDYGYCEETGESIGIGRMMAKPTATRTIEAQERLDRSTRLYAGGQGMHA